MKRKSCIYVGRVRHRRFTPVTHEFQYPLFMMYLDLAELDHLFAGRWLWSARRAAVARFRREDHLGDPGVDLDTSVRELVYSHSGRHPRGPIRLLTHLRYFGYCFNPVSFYYCFDAGDDRVEFIVAEVGNTPWGERHVYVLGAGDDGAPVTGRRLAVRKDFHVSPFMPMDIDYEWHFGMPARELSVHMRNLRRGELLFDATLRLARKPVDTWSLAATLVRFPMMTARVVGAIYFQALRLWLKRVPLFDHPATSEASETAKHP